MSHEGQIKDGVVVFHGPVPFPEGTLVRVEPAGAQNNVAPRAGLQPRTSLAEWAEKHAEDWGKQLNSEDVESFTGRRC
jgi:hypothetical protein